MRDIADRLDSANRHFRRKAAAVLIDEKAVTLLEWLYERKSVPFSEYREWKDDDFALAKLTAANFCEVGADILYVTDAGCGFIENLLKEESSL